MTTVTAAVGDKAGHGVQSTERIFDHNINTVHQRATLYEKTVYFGCGVKVTAFVGYQSRYQSVGIVSVEFHGSVGIAGGASTPATAT